MNSDAYRDCRLCPRDCRVDRTAGGRGVCGESAVPRVASIGLHVGEEPSFSGTRGSGTVFFSGCSSRCFFCQNHQISMGGVGTETTPDALFDRVAAVLGAGAHNVNFVTPDHVWPHVADLCQRLRSAGIGAPFLFNCSGYQRADRIPEYAKLVDIFLPDFKFASPDLARRCMGDAGYPVIALDAIRAMIEAKGFLDPWDPSGARTAGRGVLVRHLVLPGETENSLEALRTLRREFGRLLPLSIMCQYRPAPACAGRGEFARGVRQDEYARVLDCAEALGFESMYVQEFDDRADFSPDFSRPRPFRGNPPEQAGRGRASE